MCRVSIFLFFILSWLMSLWCGVVVQKCRSEDEARVKRLAEARKRREEEAREAAKRAAEERRAEEEERKRYAMWQTDVLSAFDLAA